MMELRTVIFTILSSFVLTSSLKIQPYSVTNEVDWGKLERCPFGQYAEGFQLKTKSSQQDVKINGIKLFCGNPYQTNSSVLISYTNKFGIWGKIHACTRDYLNGFQLMIEKYNIDGDFTASNNVRFFCSKPPRDTGDNEFGYGSWSAVQNCDKNKFICGLKTQFEPVNGDNSEGNGSIRNVYIECCDFTLPAM